MLSYAWLQLKNTLTGNPGEPLLPSGPWLGGSKNKTQNGSQMHIKPNDDGQ